jgi:hypothetical protein
VLVADDPHLVQEAESPDIRETTVKWLSEAMPSRLNNRKTGAMIVVMQRVHEGDLAGAILAKDDIARKERQIGQTSKTSRVLTGRDFFRRATSPSPGAASQARPSRHRRHRANCVLH